MLNFFDRNEQIQKLLRGTLVLECDALSSMCECVVRLFLRVVAIQSDLAANRAEEDSSAPAAAQPAEEAESEVEFAERYY